jgi:hypothetical protein
LGSESRYNTSYGDTVNREERKGNSPPDDPFEIQNGIIARLRRDGLIGSKFSTIVASQIILRHKSLPEHKHVSVSSEISWCWCV